VKRLALFIFIISFIFLSPQASSQEFAIRFNEENLEITEFERRVEIKEPADEEQRREIKNSVFSAFVNARALNLMTEEIGLKFSDEDFRKNVRRSESLILGPHPDINPLGKNATTKERVERMAEFLKRTPAEMEQDLRTEMHYNKIMKNIEETAESRYREEKFSEEFLKDKFEEAIERFGPEVENMGKEEFLKHPYGKEFFIDRKTEDLFQKKLKKIFEESEIEINEKYEHIKIDNE